MGQDQPGVREVLRELDRVQTERRDAAARVDQNRQRALVRQRCEVTDGRVVEGERLRARVELDPPRAGVQRPLRLWQRDRRAG